ncbi:MAG: hypothetical protein Q8R35_01920 [bacterium]|nr:hypothetical protein [bacterium]
MPTTAVASEVPRHREVQAAVSAAALMIKSIVLARVREIGELPAMEFATDHDHDVSSDAVGDHSVFQVSALPGIPLTSRESQWHGRPHMVVLTPTGIAKFPYVIGDAGERFPHFPKSVTDDRLWLQQGGYALTLLYPRPVTSVFHDREIPEGLVAGIGEEYCRYCQHVAPAREFRFANRCPTGRCGAGDKWDNKYGTNAD